MRLLRLQLKLYGVLAVGKTNPAVAKVVHEHNSKMLYGSRRASDDEQVTYKSSSKRRHSEFQVSPDALEIQRLQKLYTMFRKKASGGGDEMSPQRHHQLDVWLRELESRQQQRRASPYHHQSSKMADFLASPQALSLRREASAKRKNNNAPAPIGGGGHVRKHRANSHHEPQLNLPSSHRIQRAYSHQELNCAEMTFAFPGYSICLSRVVRCKRGKYFVVNTFLHTRTH